MDTLKDSFYALAKRYSSDRKLWEGYWEEIRLRHTEEGRYYHTLLHLEHLLRHLDGIKSAVLHWDVVLFCLFYHDIVYDAQKGDNEEQSAALAVARMTSLGVPKSRIEECRDMILATKSHEFSDNPDTNLFTDADLSILGSAWEDYQTYCENVRKEYAIYPDELYRPGRAKVLEHFLEMKQIYKTGLFRAKLEKQARANLKKELEILR